MSISIYLTSNHPSVCMYVVSLWSLYGDKKTMDNISIVLELQKEDGTQGGFTI